MDKIFRFGRVVLTAAALASSAPGLASGLELPTRSSPRPATTDNVPHVQIGAKVMPELRDALLQRVSGIAHVDVRNTVISLPGAKGFWLEDDLPLARPDAIVGGREFAHVHPDGSLHASLHPDAAQAAIDAGWAVLHPWSKRRPGWEGFVMIYSPTTTEELEVVFQLVRASYSFVTGRTAD